MRSGKILKIGVDIIIFDKFVTHDVSKRIDCSNLTN
jgi:hypothetical protein